MRRCLAALAVAGLVFAGQAEAAKPAKMHVYLNVSGYGGTRTTKWVRLPHEWTLFYAWDCRKSGPVPPGMEIEVRHKPYDYDPVVSARTMTGRVREHRHSGGRVYLAISTLCAFRVEAFTGG